MRLIPWLRQGKQNTSDLQTKSEAEFSLSNPQAWVLDLFGVGSTASGIAPTPRSAMRCTPVRCAVMAIAETVGQLPVHVYRRSPDGSKARDTEHPAHALLHDQANDWTPAGKLREEITRDALLYPSGGFAWINRIEGKPIELLRLDPEIEPVSVGRINGEPAYQVTEKGRPPRIIPRQDIIHIPSPSVSGLVADGREAIGLAIVMEQHAARLFGRGARPSGMLAFKSHMTPEALAKAKAAWQAAHGGENGGGTAVLPGDAAWTALTLSSVDAQFLELRKFQIEEIARLFRVPPTLLMELSRASWANSESMRRDFIDFAVRRWLTAWEGEVRLKLFSVEERKNHFVEFLLDDFVKGDLATRMDAFGKAIAARILNPNEVRALENRAPYSGGERFENPNTSAGAANG